MSATPTKARGRSIVVADPTDATSDALMGLLGGLGFHVVRCADLDETAATIVPEVPHLVFYRGEVSRLAPLTAEFPGVPVLLYGRAGELARDDLLSAMRANIADVIELPVPQDVLESRLDRVQRRSRALSAHSDARVDHYLKELEKDQRAGVYIQMGMLPPNPMAVGPYVLRHRIQPSLMLSGDFVDYFRITDDHFVFYVADVSGHGASSAFVTVLLKNFSRRVRREYQPDMLTDPGGILVWLNSELLSHRIDKHVAIWLGIIDVRTHRATFVNAGHFPPAFLVTEEGPRPLELPGKPVGLFPEVRYRTDQVVLAPNDRLVIFSDGVLEFLSGADLAAKEQRLADSVQVPFEDFTELWSRLGIAQAKVGPDDVSCLEVTRES